MRTLPNIPVGMPVRVALDIPGVNDNLYLIALNYVDYNNTTKLAFVKRYHIFTTREIIDATERYYKYMDIVISEKNNVDVVLGHTYPITYNNVNGVMTTRWFCRFSGKKMDDLDNENYCALFSARAMRRSMDRVDMFYRPSLLTRIARGLKSWLIQRVK